MNYQTGKDTQLYEVVCAIFESLKYLIIMILSNHKETLLILDLVKCLPESVLLACWLGQHTNPSIQDSPIELVGIC
jgi:hypothetical protein